MAVQAVTSINSQVTSLAPVLNSATIATDVQVSSNSSTAPINMMEKQYGGSTYVFAVEMRNQPAVATFTTPGVKNGTVTVLSEGRQISIGNSQFQDNFSGYGVHLYQFVSDLVRRPIHRPALPLLFSESTSLMAVSPLGISSQSQRSCSK